MVTKKKKNKYPTGFCANGKCEDTKPVDWKGNPMRICDFWETCPCECHARVTKLYETLGMARIDTEQSHEYLELIRSQNSKWDIPRPWEIDNPGALSSSSGGIPQPGSESAVAGRTGGPTGAQSSRFAPTPTGRRARGQLEYQVLAICQEFTQEVFDWELCLPKLVAERIGRVEMVEAPSTGAIDAVWDRWEKIGFAKRDRKPSRFVGFTGEGTEVELNELKYRAKQSKKRAVAETRRNPLAGRPQKRGGRK